MSRRGGALRRKVETRDVRPRCYIYCEGLNTEPDYFRAFKVAYPRSLFELEITGGVGGPATLLKKAIEKKKEINRLSRRDSFFSNDQVWIVFDEDQHPHVMQTINEAERVGVGVGYSNPCFELWLVLHSEFYDRPCSPAEIQRRCETAVDGYERSKGKSGDMSAVLKGLETAERHSSRLVELRQEEGVPYGAPVCTVHKLTSVLRSLDPPSKPA